MPVEGPPDTARVCYAPQLALRKLSVVLPVDAIDTWGPTLSGNVDVSRARDRFMRVFLREPDFARCTDLLWWDEDVLPDDLTVVTRLLDTGYDVVGVPYRRKQHEEQYPYQIDGDDGGVKQVEIVNDCVDVNRLAFGFMLTTRAALQKMWDAYRLERWYIDVQKGRSDETVGAFDLLYTEIRPDREGRPWRVKLSEDYSFCESYRAIGGKVRMYVGPGSPAVHIGAMAYRGTLEGLAAGQAP